MGMGIPVSRKPTRATMQRRERTHNEPKSHYAGDVNVPWNIGETVLRLKAARDMTLSDITIDCKEIISPSGNPVVVEAWKNGVYAGDQEIAHGATCFGDKNLPLKKLDEIELRVVVKGNGDAATTIKGLWFLYCVQ